MLNLLLFLLLVALLLKGAKVAMKQLRCWRLYRMTYDKKDTYERHAVADLIVDGMEDAVEKGTLTREMARRWYRRFGNILSIGDLLPKGERPLKSQIRKRLTSGTYKRVPLPDITTTPPVKKKGFLKRLGDASKEKDNQPTLRSILGD